MEHKILKNCKGPEDDKDAKTKTYVLKELGNNCFNLIKSIESSKSIIDADILRFIDETAKRIKDLNKALRGEITNNFSDLNTKLFEKIDKNDAIIKELVEGDVTDIKNKRTINVADPVEPNNVITKQYLESALPFHATNFGFIPYKLNRDYRIDFTEFTGDLLNSDLKFTINALFKLSLFIESYNVGSINVRLKIKGTLYSFKTTFSIERSLLTKVEKDNQITLDIITNIEIRIQPYLKIEVLNFLSI